MFELLNEVGTLNTTLYRASYREFPSIFFFFFSSLLQSAIQFPSAMVILLQAYPSRVCLPSASSHDSPSSLFPNTSKNSLCHRRVSFRINPRKKTWKCSASEQPQQKNSSQQQQKRKQSRQYKHQSEETDKEKGIDPVGFLPKHGISHKAFAQFLRER